MNASASSEPSAPVVESGRSPMLRFAAAVAAIAGLAASTVLFAPIAVGRSFCEPGGGCDRIARSAHATVLGVPRALVGMVAFAVLLFVAVSAAPRVRKLAPFVGVLFVIEGLRLLGLQALVLGAFCPYCVVVDVAAIVAGATLAIDGFALRSPGAVAPKAFVALGVAAAIVPLALAFTRPKVVVIPKLPRTADGKLVLREYVDLECPFCRMTHVALKKALASRPDVVVERRHVPLVIHDHAFEAAVAACCASEQGAEERFVDAVVATDAAPSEATCRDIAANIGLDLAKFDACRASDRPKQRIAEDKALFVSVGARGLPTVELDGERYVGALDDDDAKAFLARHK